MTLRLTVQENGGSTQVMVRLPNVIDPEPSGPPLTFASPLAVRDFEDLRFYLEDYAQLPVGEYAVRGERVERERLAAWGEALHAAIFGGDAARGEAYLRARGGAERGEPVEIAIQSNNPQFLALPWELMKAPGEPDPLSARVNCFDRSLPVSDPPRHFASTAEGFRVLMVIARPGGLKDVPFQAVARPLFQHFERNESAVQIEVLRPPSFEELQRRLNAAKAAGKPYHAVHFDGHGAFDDLVDGDGRQGFVVFEGENGFPQPVTAQKFAAAAKEGAVPLVILNACQSGKIETAEDAAGPEASVATRLLQEGAASVVAMSHSVYVVAAAAFMAAFYEELFAGKSVSEAVNAGRKALRLEKNSLRPSLKGEMPLQDWMVPVHYARSVLRLPQGETKPSPASAAEETAAKVLGAAKIDKGHTADDLAAIDGVFFGRDAEFFILERAIRTHGLALIHGTGGTGKTELAKAFARWLQISGGLADPRLVFFHSFEPGLPTFGLDLIVNEIMARFGNAQAYLAAGTTRERAELVLQVFRQMRCLLIWDNFETVASMPEPGQATPPLDEDKKKDLLWFIGELRKSKSALLITSRSEERWLGGLEAFVRCRVPGLRKTEVLQYVDHLLARHRCPAWRTDDDEAKAFKELIDYLGGHPLSLKLVLPRLSEASPSALLAGLKGQGALPAGFGAAEGRLESLGASIYYSFQHLSEEDQQRLVILSLFEKVVSANILGTLDRGEDAPPSRFAGLTPEGWHVLLTQLASVGLLTDLGGALYLLHPALPPFLAARWSAQAGEAFAEEHEQALDSVIHAASKFADHLQVIVGGGGDVQSALYQIMAQRHSLGAFLGAALDRHRFREADALLRALNHYWRVAGLSAEAQEWTDRVVAATETAAGGVLQIDTDAHNLWFEVKVAEAERAEEAHQLDRAEAFHLHSVESFTGHFSTKAQRRLALSYYHLGSIAMHRGRWMEAEEYHKKSLANDEALNDQAGMAKNYNQLGMVAEKRRQLVEAEEWYKKSVALKEALNDPLSAANTYHQLGNVAYYRGQLVEAEKWYKKSLAINKAFNNHPRMARQYCQLGLVAEHRGQPLEAEEWCKKALAIFEALNDAPYMAVTYFQLGALAQHRGQLAEAEGWCRKALVIFEALNDQLQMAAAYNQLGILAGLHRQIDEAEGWLMRAFAIFEALGDEQSKAETLENLTALKASHSKREPRPSLWNKLRRAFT